MAITLPAFYQLSYPAGEKGREEIFPLPAPGMENEMNGLVYVRREIDKGR